MGDKQSFKELEQTVKALGYMMVPV